MIKLNSSAPLAEDAGKLLLRVGAGGVMLLQHGLPKLMDFGELMHTFPDPIGLGPAFALTMIVLAEVLFATLLILGVWTRLSTIPLIIGMAVAVFVAHGDDILGAGELSLIYMLAFATILLVGGGRFSLDRLPIGKPMQRPQADVLPPFLKQA